LDVFWVQSLYSSASGSSNDFSSDVLTSCLVGCGIEILVSSNVGHVKLSERSADFGAEQVILVRDEKMKTRLQDQIGNVALVLTILQSKGMEFDDVILWNFFSESPSPAGIRSLNALVKDETAVFDARKNSVRPLGLFEGSDGKLCLLMLPRRCARISR